MSVEHQDSVRNGRFHIQVRAFGHEGSASLSTGTQELVLLDDFDRGRAQQVIVRLHERQHGHVDEGDHVDGVAVAKDLLVVLLPSRLFLSLLELLYDAKRRNETVLIVLRSDDHGRICHFEPGIKRATERPASEATGSAKDETKVMAS